MQDFIDPSCILGAMHWDCGLMAAVAEGAIKSQKTVWETVGWCGNFLFASRFIVQWIASERKRQVSVPVAFSWLSLGGSLLSLVYAVAQKNPVWIAGQAMAWVPYIRNLRLHYSHRAKQQSCTACGATLLHGALYCHACGQPSDNAAAGPRKPATS